MSHSNTLAAFSPSGSLAAGLSFALLTACHQLSAVPGRPSSPDSVSVAYGQQSRERTGGAVQSAATAEMQNVSVMRVEQVLAGRFAGVRVLPTPNGGFVIRVRTAAGLEDGDPLYVVDGMA